MNEDDEGEGTAGEGSTPAPGGRRRARVAEDFSVPFDIADSDGVDLLIARCGEVAFRCYLRLFHWMCLGGPNLDYSGSFAGCPRERIEKKARWRGESGAFVAALIEAELLDRVDLGGGLELLRLPDFAKHNPYVAGTGTFRADLSRKRSENGAKGGRTTQERKRQGKHGPATGADPEATSKQTPSKPKQAPSKSEASPSNGQASGKEAGSNEEHSASKPQASPEQNQAPPPIPPPLPQVVKQPPPPLPPSPASPSAPPPAPAGPSAAAPRPAPPEPIPDPARLAAEIQAFVGSKGRYHNGPSWPHRLFLVALKRFKLSWQDLCSLKPPERFRTTTLDLATMIAQTVQAENQQRGGLGGAAAAAPPSYVAASSPGSAAAGSGSP